MSGGLSSSSELGLAHLSSESGSIHASDTSESAQEMAAFPERFHEPIPVFSGTIMLL